MSERCSKETEIDKITTDLEQLKRVAYGNGERGVFGITQTLADDMIEVKADVKCLIQFQTQTETKETSEKRHKDELYEIRKENRITQRFLIGTLILGIAVLIFQTLAG